MIITAILELGAIAGFLLYAARRLPDGVAVLAAATLYGLVVEEFSQAMFGTYSYSSSFVFVIGRTPVCIALAWSVILAGSHALSETLRVPNGIAPMTDAVFALLIDVSLDAIAIRLNLWSWHGIARSDQWFGVPWTNFAGWFMVAAAFGVCLRALSHLPFRHLCSFTGGLVLSASVLFGVLIMGAHVLYHLSPTPIGAASSAVFVAALCAIGGRVGGPRRHVVRATPTDLTDVVVARGVIHIVFTGLLLLAVPRPDALLLVPVIGVISCIEWRIGNTMLNRRAQLLAPSSR